MARPKPATWCQTQSKCTMVAQPSYADASLRCYNEPGPEDMTALGCVAGAIFFGVFGLLRGVPYQVREQARIVILSLLLEPVPRPVGAAAAAAAAATTTTNQSQLS